MEGFPSGQRDQTVNLTAQPSEVRILPPPPTERVVRTILEAGVAVGFEQTESATSTASGCSSMVEPQPSKLMTWVRIPSPAPRVTRVETRAAANGGRRFLTETIAEARAEMSTLGPRRAHAGLERGRYSSAHIAQSVEHFIGKEEVTGSNPVMGSRSQH